MGMGLSLSAALVLSRPSNQSRGPRRE